MSLNILGAPRFVDIGRCALSHQCGFSSTVHGNEISEEDQWKKIGRRVEVAQEVWGSRELGLGLSFAQMARILVVGELC